VAPSIRELTSLAPANQNLQLLIRLEPPWISAPSMPIDPHEMPVRKQSS